MKLLRHLYGSKFDYIADRNVVESINLFERKLSEPNPTKLDCARSNPIWFGQFGSFQLCSILFCSIQFARKAI